MAWQVYSLRFRVLSPVHIGFERIGNVQRTRPYVPGRNLWAAVAARMVLIGMAGSYAEARAELDKNYCFGYLFPTLDNDNDVVCFPNYANGELTFGRDGYMSQAEFAYRFLGSTAHTALSLQSRGAEEGSLHEVECILPRTRRDATPVCLSGKLFVRQPPRYETEALLEHLQVGGERTYGMGRIQLLRMELSDTNIYTGFTIAPEGEAPVARGSGAVPSHWVLDKSAANNRPTQGEVEVFIGRDTTDSGYGLQVNAGRLCWAPGTMTGTERSFRVLPQGMWTELV